MTPAIAPSGGFEPAANQPTAFNTCGGVADVNQEKVAATPWQLDIPVSYSPQGIGDEVQYEPVLGSGNALSFHADPFSDPWNMWPLADYSPWSAPSSPPHDHDGVASVEEPMAENAGRYEVNLRGSISSLELMSSSDGDTIDDDSSCADLPWISADIAPHHGYALKALEMPAVNKLATSYHAWINRGENGTTVNPDDTVAGPASMSLSGGGESTGAFSAKRKMDDRPSSEAGDQGGPVVKKRRKQVLEGEIRLACHFQKRDPERNMACGIQKAGFTTIAQIKQHFSRVHMRNPNYCIRCKLTFTTETERDAHIMNMATNPCLESHAALPQGLSLDNMAELTKRADTGHTIGEQWFSMWDTIFPGVQRPASCTFDLSGETHVQLLGFAAYLEREGPGILQDTLREHNFTVLPGLEHFEAPGAEDWDVFERRVFSLALRQAYDRYQAQRPQPNASAVSAQTGRNPRSQPSQHLPATPSSSGSGRTLARSFPAPDGLHGSNAGIAREIPDGECAEVVDLASGESFMDFLNRGGNGPSESSD